MKKISSQEPVDNRMSNLLIGFGVVIAAYFRGSVGHPAYLFPGWFRNSADHHLTALCSIGIGLVAIGCWIREW